MGLFSFGGGDSNTSYNQNSTTMPILSPQWTSAYGNASTNAGTTGITPTQQPGINYFTNQLNQPWMANTIYGANTDTNKYQHSVTDQANNALYGVNAAYQNVNNNVLTPLINSAAPQSSGATSVNAQSGASQSNPYASLYGSQVTDPALAAYDYGTDRAMSALDARTAGAGGFANSRSGLAYSDLASQAALGRGQLSAQLNSQGLTNAFGFGQQDASRDLTGQTTNAANTLNNNQFNANAQLAKNAQNLTAASQLSANATNNANVNQQILANQMGMSQQGLSNLVNSITTANGIDSNAAQQLVNSGAITQQQLAQIVQLAQASNGSQNNISGNSNTASFKFGFGGS